MDGLFGFNYHDFSLVGNNCHTHLGAIVMKSLKLLVQVLVDSSKKNDIIDVEEKSDDITGKLSSFAPYDLQTLL